ncbi:unnamed protein product [Oppiella nova]|uniref:C2H2-type domain-containing protein n=1 Tax=Oppiella nova TaxID=334625 RepID=A0A7R9M7M1_9ACAR|nr:unnamed protein product [Oppiella nova]CAG2172134.1 unnamed protein product [Oppiella nova]
MKHSKDKQFKCDFDNCNKVSRCKTALFLHKNVVHLNVRFVCDWSECDKQFTHKSHYFDTKVHSLIEHKRIHSAEKPFICHMNGCLKRFHQLSSLYRHKRIHYQQK